eukprot:6492720-Amphidinium_carterae.2
MGAITDFATEAYACVPTSMSPLLLECDFMPWLACPLHDLSAGEVQSLSPCWGMGGQLWHSLSGGVASEHAVYGDISQLAGWSLAQVPYWSSVWGPDMGLGQLLSVSPLCHFGEHFAQGSAEVPAHRRVMTGRKEELALRVATYNILTLGAQEHREASLLNEAGSVAWLQHRFADLHLSMVGLQETRVSTSGDLMGDCFRRLCTPAENGRGGLQLWIAKKEGAKVLWFDSPCHRILRAGLLVRGKRILVLTIHAPHAKSELEVNIEFCNSLQECVLEVQADYDETVILGDFNLRTKGLEEFHAVGEHSFSSCREEDLPRARMYACALDRLGVLLLNTWHHHESPATWVHSTGMTAQIDYVAATRSLARHARDVYTVDSACISTGHASDHNMVVCSLCWAFEKTKVKKRPSEVKRFVDEDHRLAFMLRLRLVEPVPAPSDQVTPDVQLDLVLRHLHRLLQDTAPKKEKAVRKPWISTCTWRWMEELSQTRKRKKSEFMWGRHCLLLAVWRVWSGGGTWDWDYFCVTAVQRRLLRQDRADWLGAKCRELEGLMERNYSKEYYKLIRTLTSWEPRQNMNIRDEHGRPPKDEKENHQNWVAHWSRSLGVAEIESGAQVDFSSVALDPYCVANLDQGPEDQPVFREEDILHALQTSKPGKVSPDIVSIDVAKACAADIVPILTSACNHYARCGEVPTSWMGAVVIPVWKKKGSPQDPANYRPISLLLWSQKLASGAMLRRLMGTIELDDAQLANRKKVGVDFAQLVATQLRTWCYSEGLSLLMMFVDISDAFNSCWRHILFGGGRAAAEDLTAADYDAYTAQRVAEWFMVHHQDILTHKGVDPRVRDLLRVEHGPTWVQVLSEGGSSKLLTRQGLKQGCRLAPFLYALYASAAKSDIQRNLELSGLLQSLPAPSEESFPVCEEGRSVPFFTIDWVDDMLQPRWASTPTEAVAEAQVAYAIALQGLSDYGLRPNHKKGKTELLTVLRGPCSRSLQMGLKEDGGLQLAGGTLLRTTSSYRHLGVLLGGGVSSTQHIRAAAASARASNRKLSRLLKNQVFPRHLKLRLVSTFSLSRLQAT